jgi:hypothetical protein
VKVFQHCYNIQPGIFFFFLQIPVHILLPCFLVTTTGVLYSNFIQLLRTGMSLQIYKKKKKLKTHRNIFRAFFLLSALKGLTSTTVNLCWDFKKNKMKFNHIATMTNLEDLKTYRCTHIYTYKLYIYVQQK